MSDHGGVASSDTGCSASGNRVVDINASDLVLQMEGTVPKQKIKPKFSFGNKSNVATVFNSHNNRQQIQGSSSSRGIPSQLQRGVGSNTSSSILISANGIIDKVFNDVASQNKLTANIRKVDESLWGHLYVRNKFTGGEAKRLNEDMEHGIKCVFGISGSLLVRFLYRITWILLKRDIEGIHVVNSYKGKKLNKRVEDASVVPIQYSQEIEDIDFEEEMSHLFSDLGDSLIHLLVGDIEEDVSMNDKDVSSEDEEENSEDDEPKLSSSSTTKNKETNSSTLKSFDTEIFHIFEGICSRVIAAKALRLFLMYRLISKSELDKMDIDTTPSHEGGSISAIRHRGISFLQHALETDAILDFNDVISKNSSNLHSKWMGTMNYHVKSYYQSVAKILIGEWGFGSSVAGIFGIHPRHRATLLLEDETSIVGARFGSTENPAIMIEDKMTFIFPSLESAGINRLKQSGRITKEGSDNIIDIISYVGTSDTKIVTQMAEKFGPPNEENYKDFVDNVTPVQFRRMIFGRDYPIKFIQSIKLLYNLVDSIGIGSVDYSAEDVTLCKMGQYIVGQVQDDTNYPSIICIPKHYVEDPITGEKSTEYFTKGSIFMSFLAKMREHEAFIAEKDKKDKISVTSSKYRSIPSEERIEKRYITEEFTQFAQEECDRSGSELDELRNDPVITLMRLIAWNETTCRVPLSDLKGGFADFYSVYSCEYLARMLLLMLVAAQYPFSNVLENLKTMVLTQTSRLHIQMFTGGLISPDALSILTTVLKCERELILNNVPLWEQKWALSLLNILAPKDIYRMDHFGLDISKVSKKKGKKGNNLDKRVGKRVHNREGKVISSKTILTQQYGDNNKNDSDGNDMSEGGGDEGDEDNDEGNENDDKDGKLSPEKVSKRGRPPGSTNKKPSKKAKKDYKKNKASSAGWNGEDEEQLAQDDDDEDEDDEEDEEDKEAEASFTAKETMISKEARENKERAQVNNNSRDQRQLLGRGARFDTFSGTSQGYLECSNEYLTNLETVIVASSSSSSSSGNSVGIGVGVGESVLAGIKSKVIDKAINALQTSVDKSSTKGTVHLRKQPISLATELLPTTNVQQPKGKGKGVKK